MTTEPPETPKVKLKWYEQVCCCLPLVLIFVGGMIGGACGGVGYALSKEVFKGTMPTPAKYVISLLISVAAAGMYLGVIIMLASFFPDLVKR